MALTRPFLEQWNEGNVAKIIADLVLPSSYAAGGVPITAGDLGMSKIIGARELGVVTGGVGALYRWNTSTGKLMVILPTGGADTSPTTLAAPGVVLAAGSGTPDSATITPGVGKEIAATADLGAITVRLEFTCIP